MKASSTARRRKQRQSETLATTLGELYNAREFERALEIARRLLKIVASIYPDSAPEVFDARRNVAELLRVNGDPPGAEAELRAIMKEELRLKRTMQLGFSETCNNLATCLMDQKRYAEAARHLKQSIRVLEKLPDPGVERIVVAYKNLGEVLISIGADEEAVGCFCHGLELSLAMGVRGATTIGDCLERLVQILLQLGRIAQAEDVVRCVEADFANDNGFGTPLTVEIMLCRGAICDARFLRHEAADWNRKALIHANEDFAGPMSLLAIRAAASLSASYSDLGMFSEALELAQWATRQAATTKNSDVLFPLLLTILGRALRQAGHHYRARACLKEVLQMEERRSAVDGRVDALENLALLCQSQGRTREAIQHIEEAIRIAKRKKLGPHVLRQLLNLHGSFLVDAGQYDRAEESLMRSLALADPIAARSDDQTAKIFHSLGSLNDKRGDLLRASEYYQKALGITSACTGNEVGLETTAIWNNLGSLAHRQLRYDEATAFYENALRANRAGHDDSHPDSVSTLFNLSAVEWARGNWSLSLQLRAQGVKGAVARLPALLAGGREQDGRHAVEELRGRIYSTLSFHFANPVQREESAYLAATLIVQVKGRALDAMVHDLALIHAERDGEIARLLRRLRRVRRWRAEFYLQMHHRAEPLEKSRLERMRLREEEILEELQSKSAATGKVQESVTIEAVTALLPPGSALVEFVRFGVFQAASAGWNGYHYAALILRNGWAPIVLDIGSADTIEAEARILHAALRSAKGAGTEPARRLYDAIFQPLMPYLEDTTNIFVIPDGLLNAVPFAALIDQEGRFLMWRYVISYLSSARDVVGVIQKSRQAPVFVVDAEDLTIQIGLSRERRMARVLFPDATVVGNFMHARRLISSLHGPRVIHFAVHGAFFVSDSDSWSSQSARGPEAGEGGMLNAVLALTDRGELRVFLTALEAASLDLHGTQLVVLASCESALGMILNGEGIYGFRRALKLAGAAAQLTTLWRVEDESMAELMAKFYSSARNLPPGLALALAQRALAASENWSHPHFWAALALSCGPQELHLWEAPMQDAFA